MYVEWVGASTGNAKTLVEHVLRKFAAPGFGRLWTVKIALLHSYQPCSGKKLAKYQARREGTINFWTKRMEFHEVKYGAGNCVDGQILWGMSKGRLPSKPMSEEEVCDALDIPFHDTMRSRPDLGLLVKRQLRNVNCETSF